MSSQRRDLGCWLAGFGSSQLADQIFALALTWAAIQLGTPGQAGLVIAVGSLPRIVILLLGGVLADRFNPRRMIIGSDAARTLVMVAAAVAVLITGGSLLLLVVVGLLVGALDGLFQPAVGALPARIADEQSMSRVAALRTTTTRIVLLGGAPLAGGLIAWTGTWVAFAASALLFAGSVVALLPVRLSATYPDVQPAVPAAPAAATEAALAEPVASPPSVPPRDRPEGRPSVLAEVVAGLTLTRRHPLLPWLLVIIGVVNFGFAGPVTAGIPLLAQREGWGAPGAGILLGAFGLGAAAAGITLVFVRRIRRAGMVGTIAAAAMGAALAAVVLLPSFAIAVAAAIGLGAASGVFGTSMHALLLTSVPAAELGRVMSLATLVLEGVVPISLALTGAAVAGLGVVPVFEVGGVMVLAVALLGLTRSTVRHAQLPATATAEAKPTVS